MCSSQDPLITDERTTTETSTVNYETNLPRELTTFRNITISDTKMLFIQMHMNFSSEICIAHKNISMQEQPEYVRADVNIIDNY
jgi:hypothetical protein